MFWLWRMEMSTQARLRRLEIGRTNQPIREAKPEGAFCPGVGWSG